MCKNSKAPTWQLAPGKIYILRNTALRSTLVKIGRTSRSSESRAVEISVGTGVPLKYEVLYEEDVIDTVLAEKLVHDRLKKFRVNPRREFFNVTLKDAVRMVFEVCQSVNAPHFEDLGERIAFYVPAAYVEKNPCLLDQLKTTLTLYRSSPGIGVATVAVVYSSHTAEVVLKLGDEWSVKVSEQLLHDLCSIAGISAIDLFDTGGGYRTYLPTECVALS